MVKFTFIIWGAVLFFLYLTVQKNPAMALFFLIVIIFYKYLKRRKDATQVLSKGLDAQNALIKQITSIPSILQNTNRVLSRIGTSSTSDDDLEENLFSDSVMKADEEDPFSFGYRKFDHLS